MKDIGSLLKEVGEIVNRYEEEDRKTGRRFNVYSIAEIERDEVKTHSRMIAELLDPKGSHGQGVLFLKLFFEQFGFNPEYKNPIVNYEKKYNPYGQVDIEIILDDQYIIIENKIDAPDQPKQLERYSDIAEEVKKYSKDKYTLLYLTKYGREPSKDSLGSIEKSTISENEVSMIWKKGDYPVKLRLISYRENIRDWIEECIKQSIIIPNIRDGLTQYLNLVKKITGIERTSVMDHIIEHLSNTTENLKNAAQIASAFNSSELRGKILFNFFENVQKKLEEKKYIKINREDIIDNDQKYLYNDSNNTAKPCIQWFERKTTKGEKGKRSWEGKGFFMKIPDIDTYYLHVQVATEALYYGIITKDSNKNFDEIQTKNDFEKRVFWNELKWITKMEHKNIASFDESVIELLLSDGTSFSQNIDSEIKELLGI
jgi:uncharacterized protein (UPF0297 family)